MTPLVAGLAIASIARLTLLVTRDEFPFEPVREWLSDCFERKQSTPRAWASDLIECPWCVSIWLGFGGLVPFGILVVGGAWWAWAWTALAGSLLAGVVGEVLER